MIRDMVKASRNMQMVANIRETFQKVNNFVMSQEKHMVKDHIHGQMESFMKVNGQLDFDMDMENGFLLEARVILENGRKVDQMDMEFINGQMVYQFTYLQGTNTKESGKIA